VGENRFGLRSLFDDGGSGAVCDRPFIDLFDPEWGRFLCSNPYLLGSVNYKQAVSVLKFKLGDRLSHSDVHRRFHLRV